MSFKGIPLDLDTNWEIYGTQHTEPCPLRELFQCILCEYQSSRKSNLKKHFMIHTKEKPFKCNDCNFCAATKSTLVLHVRTHTGEKPYECAICQRKFSRRNIIKAHVKTHTNDKPFKCSECNFITSRKDNLNFHMRRHLIDKPFKCHMCTCSFVQKCRYNRHLDLHTKAFKCFLCCYETHLEMNLLKHKLTHLKENLFICFLCGKDFCKKYGVRAHITKVHSKEECHLKNKDGCLSLPTQTNDDITNVNKETSEFNKTFSDKAIATDDLNDLVFSQLSSAETIVNENVGLTSTHIHGFVCSNSCDVSVACNSNSSHINEVIDSNTVNFELNPNSIVSESTSDIEYSNVNEDSSFGSSSDSEVDSLKFPYTINFSNVQENVVEQNVTIMNPDIYFNYQPNMNYILGLNVMQPIVLPTVPLQSHLNTGSPLVLASPFNNMQVNQDINFVPVYNNTNLFINNYVPNVPDSNLLLNPGKPVFISEMF